MVNKKSIENLEVRSKRVLVRCDFNVPMMDGKITADARIVAALPTIKKLVNEGARVILCSHMGKPKGAEEKFSLAPVAVRLAELLEMPVKFAADDDVVCENARAAVSAMVDGDIVLLQNTRYHADETKNGEGLSKALASIADVFVNDAFGAAHRAHSSTAGVAKFVNESAVGYLMQKEVEYLGSAVNNPARPFVAILGGAKVSDKLGVITNLLEKVDVLIIGGGMAYTFLAAQGYTVGQSLLESDKIEYAKEMMQKAKEKGVKLLLPIDTVVATHFAKDAEHKIVPSNEIPDDWMGLDIGVKTRELFANACADAKTVI